ncbi:MAG: F0F1 ATP synthase subunit B [Ferruginibacter sp.]|nr:F0F1 ATP synthase subunit B [Cytophagales bacterium]
MELVTPGLGLLFWQALIFIIVLFILSRYAWKPILGGLKEREASIDSALQAANQARQEMANLQATNEQLLAETRAERDRILRAAQVSSERIIQEAREKAQSEGNRILAETQQSIRNERQAAMADIRKEIVNLSVEIAEKLLRKELQNQDAQKALVSDLVRDAQLN